MQERILHLCRERRNVFFSGMGGTGKSFLIRRIVKTLERELNAKVAVTAPTGVAALLIGGQTLHSFAGCNVPSTIADLEKCWCPDKAACWRDLDVLIIDEVTMINIDEVSMSRLVKPPFSTGSTAQCVQSAATTRVPLVESS